MEDQISRQELIEELGEMKKYFCAGLKGAFVSLEDVVYIIKSQSPADQWIPCSEPPKEDGMYFITAEVLGKLEVQYVFYQKNLNLFICNGTPTAWMPLPEAYKGEQHEYD